MSLNVKNFSFIAFFILFGVLYAVFVDYYFKQREKTAYVILKSLQNDMSEMSYVLSKHIGSKEDVKTHRALMERYVSNNDFVKAIMVIDTSELLFTTDRYYNSAPAKYMLSNGKALESYTKLLDKKGIESVLRYYEGAEQKELTLLYMLDQDEIISYFEENKVSFAISFGLYPVLVLIMIFEPLGLYGFWLRTKLYWRTWPF